MRNRSGVFTESCERENIEADCSKKDSPFLFLFFFLKTATFFEKPATYQIEPKSLRVTAACLRRRGYGENHRKESEEREHEKKEPKMDDSDGCSRSVVL